MSWMSWEVFESGLTIAELVVGVAGLGVGGFVGVTSGALARTRTEDRRTILLELIPQMQLDKLELFIGGELHALSELRRAKSAFDETSRRAALLPWPDRTAWERASAIAPAALRTSSEVLSLELRIEGSGVWYRPDRPGEPAAAVLKRVASQCRGAWPSDTDSAEYAESFRRRLGEFEEHLHRGLRPSRIRRLLDLRYKVTLGASWAARKLSRWLRKRPWR